MSRLRCRLGRWVAAWLLVLLVLLPLHKATEDPGALLAIEDDKTRGSTQHDAAGRGAASGGLGSGSMSNLLAWAVQHGDPDRLKEVVAKFNASNLSLEEYYGKDVMDALLRNEGREMRDKIWKVADYRNTSLSDDELEAAIYDLQELIEQVDNAGNLHKMQGMLPLLEISLNSERSSSTRSLALWTLGIAAQNNEPVQNDLLDIDGLRVLSERLPRCKVDTEESQSQPVESFEYCGKLVLALSALVRNNVTTLASADALGLYDWLIDVGVPHVVPGVAKKAFGLLETALAQNPDLPFLDRLSARKAILPEEILRRLQEPTGDIDLLEKVLRFWNRLLSLRPFFANDDFREKLKAASEVAGKTCGSKHGEDDEVCQGLEGLARHADVMLAARDVSDEEL